MKIKRLLPILLLSSSLLLTSCEDLLSGFIGGNSRKKSSEEDSEYYGGQGYQGKQGATELSQEEWYQAFSLEEFAFRRSVHVEAGSTLYEASKTTIDADNGKFAVLFGEDGLGNDPVYLNFESIDKNGVVTATYYYQDSDGNYVAANDQAPLDITMAEMGILNYQYNDFTYDKNKKEYVANSFTYRLSYQGEEYATIEGKDAHIVIENGFPKSVEFDYDVEVGGAIESTHYVARYSNYNKTVVTLPDVNGGNNNNNNGGNELPTPEGNEITYNQLVEAYNKRTIKEFNHAEYRMVSDDVAYTGSSTLLFGMWEEDEGSMMGLDVSSFVIDDEMMDGLAPMPGNADYQMEYYYNVNNDEYIIHAYYNILGMGISTNIYISKYFYVNAEFIIMSDTYTSLEIEWSTITIPEGTVMKVANRAFVGVDVLEKDFVYYDAVKEVTEGAALYFEEEYCKMVNTKASTGNEVSDYDATFLGRYVQNGTTVTVTFEYFLTDTVDDYTALPNALTVELTVSDDKLLTPSDYSVPGGNVQTVHLIFAFDKPFDDYIYYPGDNGGNQDIGDNPLGGYYFYKECKLVVFNEESRETAERDFASVTADVRDLESMFFYISEYSETITLYAMDGRSYYGDYIINNGLISMAFNTVYDEQGNSTDTSLSLDLIFSDEEIYFDILSGGDYIIYAIYSRA